MSIRKGDILLTGGPQDISSKEDKSNKVTSVSESSTDLEYPSAGALYRALLEKQNNLISGTNIKTINGESLLGSGNIEVSGGGSFDPYAYNIQTKQTLDLTNFSSDYFYPLYYLVLVMSHAVSIKFIWGAERAPIRCAIICSIRINHILYSTPRLVSFTYFFNKIV